LTLPAPIWVQLEGPSYIEVNRENFGKLFDMKRADSHDETLQESMSVLSVSFVDIL
jgi:hypothetical protein